MGEDNEATHAEGVSPSEDTAPAAGGSRAAARTLRRWGDRLLELRRTLAPRARILTNVKATVAIVVVIFLFEYFVVPDIASARKSLVLLGRVNIVLLVVAVGLEAGALTAYAQISHTVLSPDAPPRWRLFRINMASLAVSHVLPGGPAPGAALSYRLLGDSGVPGSTAAFGLAVQGVGSAVVLNIIFWLSLLISIPLSGYNRLYGFAALVGVVLLAALGGTLLLLLRGKHGPADRLLSLVNRLPLVPKERTAQLIQSLTGRLNLMLAHRELLRRAAAWAAANWMLDAASLWIFVAAFGHVLSPIDLLVAYGLVNILAVIPITPSGLGIVEAVLTPTLVGFGTPKTVAILGVLGWRLVNFWLPIPLGGASYLALRYGPTGRAARAGGARTRHRRIAASRGAGHRLSRTGRPDPGLLDPGPLDPGPLDTGPLDTGLEHPRPEAPCADDAAFG